MANRNVTLVDGADQIFPKTRDYNVYNSNNESLDNTIGNINSGKANVNASNLTSTNVTSWKNKLLATSTQILNITSAISTGDKALSDSITNYSFLLFAFTYSNYRYVVNVPTDFFKDYCYDSSRKLYCSTEYLGVTFHYKDDNTITIDSYTSQPNGLKVFGIK